MEMKKLYTEKRMCCGCGACVNACAQNALSMKPDQHGFLYPQIDSTKCVGCGICEKVCTYGKEDCIHSQSEVYVAASQNTNPKESASGGLFASIAKNVLSSGGIVYGCAMLREDNSLVPRHTRVMNENDLILLKGSKYVQSEIGTIYRDVKKDLQDGLQVLFSGTPCQIAGLKGYLRKSYSNLFTIDIICHGVPSAQMFQDYLTFEEQRRKKKIVEFKFRDKAEGWKLHGKMVLEDENGKRENVYFEPEQSSYYQMFLNSYTYRENCYACPYACDNRPGDITIGDYWCIDLVHPEMLVQNGGIFDEQKGVSCLIVNNTQGQKLVSLYGEGIEKRASTFENAARYNGQLKHASLMKSERSIVFEKYGQGYREVEKWYWRRQIPIIVKRKIRAAVPRKAKDFAKFIAKHAVGEGK